MPSVSTRFVAWVMRNRARLPRFLRDLPGVVERNPRGLLSRAAYRILGGDRVAPPPSVAPDTPRRVLVAPANHAGQGARWAKALEAHVPGTGARSLAVAIPGSHSFPVDTAVPVTVYWHSRRWQEAERSAVLESFDHVLIESMRPVFGGLYPDLRAESTALRRAGISLAYLAHGTDIRSPRRHAATHRWSPYLDDPRAERLQRVSDENRAFALSTGAPLFVSTPDLLVDLPGAAWCPVVVDPAEWTGGAPPLGRTRTPVVAHIPSSAAVKGTALIEPALHRLHEQGLIDYRRLQGIAAADMPAAVRDADILLDQFRIGSYGVAACEAMAAGRIVISHVSDEVRAHVRAASGADLPILEADPDSLESVLSAVIADPAAAHAAAARGPEFVADVHSGVRSAAVLATHWLDRSES